MLMDLAQCSKLLMLDEELSRAVLREASKLLTGKGDGEVMRRFCCLWSL